MNETEFREALRNILCNTVVGASFCNRCPFCCCFSMSQVKTKDLLTVARLAYKYKYPRATSVGKHLLNSWGTIARKYTKGGAKIV